MNPAVITGAPLLAQCSLAAYLPSGEAWKAMAGQGLFQFEAFGDPSSDIRGFVAANDDIVVVSFMGTKSLRNWLTDFRIRMTVVAGGRVHMGFWNALQSVLAQINEIVSRLGKGKKLFVTGHSLGGALAMLYAFFGNSAPVQGVVTFGQPRVGDGAFSKAYDDKLGSITLRVVHECDIVPRVPLVWLWTWVQAYKKQSFFDGLGFAHDDMPEWARVPFDMLDLWQHFRMKGLLGLEEPVQDHSMDLYAALKFQ